MAMSDVTADDVLTTLAEFNELGRDAFLAKYGFRPARAYLLEHDGRFYDSKAVVGAAHTHSVGRARRAAEFSGGDATVKRHLEGLGFHVTGDATPRAAAVNAASATRRVTDESLGAWVLKCNPDTWDIAGFIADGETWIDDWTVVQNYRSDMMRHGQRVLLWVTGDLDGALPRGFWGSGWITGAVQPIFEAPDDDSALPAEPPFKLRSSNDDAAGEPGKDYWLDPEVRDRMHFAVPTDLTLWAEPVRETTMTTTVGLTDLEVIRSRQVSNPSWISAEQLALLAPHLPRWPPLGEPASEQITIDSTGAGFADPYTQRAVETAAISVVGKHYRGRGHTVASVEHQRCGWDLTCTAPNGDVDRVEVKGLGGNRLSVLLTRNELRSAREDPGWVLAIVTSAVTKPQLRFITAADAITVAEPYVYRLDFAPPA